MNKKRWMAVGIAIVLLVISLAVPSYTPEDSPWAEQLDSLTAGLVPGNENSQEKIIQPGNTQQRILVLELDGTIMGGANSNYLSPGVYNHDFFLSQLDQVLEDQTIQGILFTVNTPGGGVYESAEIRDRILKIKEERNIPVYVSMLNMAASGGYYVSADATKIFATEETWTGSIGVISQVMDFSGLLERYGVQVHSYASGNMKTMGSPYKAPTEEEVAIWNELTNEAYDRFVNIIVNGRGLSEEEVRTLADGRIYSGRQAMQIGLVDVIGSKEEALEALRVENNLQGAEIFEYSFTSNQFLDMFGSFMKANNDISELETLQSLLDRQIGNTPTPYYLYGGQ